MSISPGSRIGPYEVTSQLGEGGMGVVYRGRDVRLQRDVALKVLPDHFANDPDRLSRFQREAQLLASLNHSNIAQIYGLEQVEGSTCIVMELVEGETLADRLKKGPMSSDEAMEIARQIADALAAAHERGIVHRDLKPANIKLTSNGTVKVLDFGLAKALGSKGSDPAMTAMPTMASGSIVGSVVGTPGYMSPEQARGKEVDARTDIWAFGCVLYEMLSGKQAFDGETVTDIMAKIVTSSPDLNLLPKNTPPSVRALLSATLHKNSTQRLQHIGDTRLFLDGTLGAASTPPSEVSFTGAGRTGRLVIPALIAALAIAAIPAVLYFRTPAPESSRMLFDLALQNSVGIPAVSPNGRTLLYLLQPADGKRSLWIRPIDSETATRLAGTEDANGMFWAPDNRRIAFVSDGKLRTMDTASGGAPQVLAEVGQLRGADWNSAGTILFSSVKDNVISRIADTGGEVTKVTSLDEKKGEALHGVPAFLPDGKHFVYVSAGKQIENSHIVVGLLDSGEPHHALIQVRPSNFNGLAYAPTGHLLVLNGGRLTAQRLDDQGRALTGEPAVIAEEVQGGFSFSQNGLLLYRKVVPQAVRQLRWFTRKGQQEGAVGAEGPYGNVDISPSGDRAAVDLMTGDNRDIWSIDLERNVPARVTFNRGSDWSGSWSADGSRITFASARTTTNATRIVEKSSSGAGEEVELSTEHDAIPIHRSPDDKYIVYSRNKGSGTYDTWLMPTSGERKPYALLESPFDKMQVRVSPDSRYVAYTTNESGTYQIVVQTFPDPNGGKWIISADGGTEPKWRRDGRELYYLAFDGKLMMVPITYSPTFKAGKPEVLFQTPHTLNRAQPGRDRRYDVAPDGRFLFIIPASSAAANTITAMVNWDAALKK